MTVAWSFRLAGAATSALSTSACDAPGSSGGGGGGGSPRRCASETVVSIRTGIAARTMRFMRTSVAVIRALVPIVIGLVGSVDRDADVVRLILRQLRQLHAELVEVQPRDLFVELLRQHEHGLAVLFRVRVQLEL